MKFTKSQIELIENLQQMLESGEIEHNTSQMLHIARRSPCGFTWDGYDEEVRRGDQETVYVRGYSKSAFALVQKNILVRDSLDHRFQMSNHGLKIIKEYSR